MDSKSLVINTHKLLREMGHEMPLGQVYEMYAKLSGHKSWNVASTKDGVAPVLKVLGEVVPGESILPVGQGNFEVKIVNEDDGIEIKKYYRVTAKSESEAEAIVASYIKYRCEEDQTMLEIPGVRALADNEDYHDFVHSNWEVIDNRHEPKVQKGSTYRLKDR